MELQLKNPAVQKTLLCGVIGAGALGVFFLTHLVPFSFPNQRDKLSALKSDYDRKSTELARARATVSDLPRFEAEYDRLHQRWINAAELLPTDRQVPVLLRKITLAAQQTGVQFVMFRPNDTKVQDHYTELPLQLSVTGGYHQIGSFVAELSNMRRIVTVSNLQLKANSKGETDGSTVAAEFTASAYSLNASGTPEPAPAAAPAKGGGSHARKAS